MDKFWHLYTTVKSSPKSRHWTYISPPMFLLVLCNPFLLIIPLLTPSSHWSALCHYILICISYILYICNYTKNYICNYTKSTLIFIWIVSLHKIWEQSMSKDKLVFDSFYLFLGVLGLRCWKWAFSSLRA